MFCHSSVNGTLNLNPLIYFVDFYFHLQLQGFRICRLPAITVATVEKTKGDHLLGVSFAHLRVN